MGVDLDRGNLNIPKTMDGHHPGLPVFGGKCLGDVGGVLHILWDVPFQMEDLS